MYNQKPLLGTLPNYAHSLTPNVGAWIMNEDSGDKILDTIGRNRGTFEGNVAWLNGRVDFPGANGDLVNIPTINLGKNHSIVIEIIYDAVDKIIVGGEGNYYIYLHSTRLYYRAANENIYEYHGMTTGTKYQIAITRSGTTVKFYKNGSQLGTPQTVTDVDFIISTIGAYNDGTYAFNGRMNYVYFFSNTLTSSQISQLYINPYCWLAQPMEAELMYAAPPAGVMSPYYYETLMAGAVI